MSFGTFMCSSLVFYGLAFLSTWLKALDKSFWQENMASGYLVSFGAAYSCIDVNVIQLSWLATLIVRFLVTGKTSSRIVLYRCLGIVQFVMYRRHDMEASIDLWFSAWESCRLFCSLQSNYLVAQSGALLWYRTVFHVMWSTIQFLTACIRYGCTFWSYFKLSDGTSMCSSLVVYSLAFRQCDFRPSNHLRLASWESWHSLVSEVDVPL